MPHEILTGVRDPAGVKLRPALFMLDEKAHLAHAEVVERMERDRERDG